MIYFLWKRNKFINMRIMIIWDYFYVIVYVNDISYDDWE